MKVKIENIQMRQYFSIFIYLFTCFLFLSCMDKESTQPGKEVIYNDVIEVVDYKGLQPYLEADEEGTIYVVNFWAMWCAPCVEELPYLEELAHKNKNVKLLLVSMDFTKEIETKLKPFLINKKITSEVILMDDPDSNYWIDEIDPNWSGAIPFTIIFNKNKKMFYERSFENVKDLEYEINKFN